MPSPQVNDRLKEVPAQVLRTLFATIGQLLLVADRFRARAVEQLSGTGEPTPAGAEDPAGPEDQAPAAAPPATPPAPRAAPAQDTERDRWRSLDKTGNVRLLHGDDEQDAEDLAASASPSATGSSISEPATPAPEPVHAPVEYAPAEPVAAVPAPAEPQATDPAVPEPADLAVPPPAEPAVPQPADLAVPPAADPAVPEPAGLAPAEPAPAGPTADSGEPAGAALPVPNYDQLSVPSLRARLRGLDAAGVEVLLDYEKAHEGRPAVITMFERRLTKLSEGI
jgi:hypothetical protein